MPDEYRGQAKRTAFERRACRTAASSSDTASIAAHHSGPWGADVARRRCADASRRSRRARLSSRSRFMATTVGMSTGRSQTANVWHLGPIGPGRDHENLVQLGSADVREPPGLGRSCPDAPSPGPGDGWAEADRWRMPGGRRRIRGGGPAADRRGTGGGRRWQTPPVADRAPCRRPVSRGAGRGAPWSALGAHRSPTVTHR